MQKYQEYLRTLVAGAMPRVLDNPDVEHALAPENRYAGQGRRAEAPRRHARRTHVRPCRVAGVAHPFRLGDDRRPEWLHHRAARTLTSTPTSHVGARASAPRVTRRMPDQLEFWPVLLFWPAVVLERGRGLLRTDTRTSEAAASVPCAMFSYRRRAAAPRDPPMVHGTWRAKNFPHGTLAHLRPSRTDCLGDSTMTIHQNVSPSPQETCRTPCAGCLHRPRHRDQLARIVTFVPRRR